MDETTALRWAVHYFIVHAHNDLKEDKEGRDDWLSILKERVRALIPFIEKNQMSCLIDAKSILEM